jgi:uncharacterized protein YdcH (DUF465 family)
MDDGLHKLYREQLSQYKSVNAVLHDLAWTLSELEQQIAALLGDVDTTDENETQRLSDLRRWKSALEDSVLRQMLRADELAAQVASVRARLRAEPGQEEERS